MIAVVVLLVAAAGTDARLQNLPSASTLEVLETVPVEDPACLEGIFFADGALYLSNGWYGESALLKINAKTGGELKRFDVHQRIFAEGLARIGETFFQLTYTDQVAFMYKETPAGFELLGNRSYPSKEGWGLTTDGKLLIMSDSSAQLIFIDPETWHEVKRVTVVDAEHQPVTWINELEWVDGMLLANHFLSQELLVINPNTGTIDAWFDLSSLNPARTPRCKCRCGPPTANGIAYDPDTDRLWVTGKDWPNYYLVQLTFPDGKKLGTGAGGRESSSD